MELLEISKKLKVSETLVQLCLKQNSGRVVEWG